mmetsp:Transcript_19082/g.34109  ORF Transcript_19082/g.34109 Transcript_19082/m.34109 type:complete len:249 (+) Transcript_19082:1311-2057(+)
MRNISSLFSLLPTKAESLLRTGLEDQRALRLLFYLEPQHLLIKPPNSGNIASIRNIDAKVCHRQGCGLGAFLGASGVCGVLVRVQHELGAPGVGYHRGAARYLRERELRVAQDIRGVEEARVDLGEGGVGEGDLAVEDLCIVGLREVELVDSSVGPECFLALIEVFGLSRVGGKSEDVEVECLQEVVASLLVVKIQMVDKKDSRVRFGRSPTPERSKPYAPRESEGSPHTPAGAFTSRRISPRRYSSG